MYELIKIIIFFFIFFHCDIFEIKTNYYFSKAIVKMVLSLLLTFFYEKVKRVT